MDTIKDIVASFFGSLRERLGHPLIGAFAIAWAVWNFRVLLVLVGDGDGGWLAKIEYLDKKLMVPEWMWIVHGLVIPLAVSLTWLLILPPALRWFSIYHLRQVVKTKEAVVAIQDLSPMKGQEVAELRARVRKDRQQWGEERAQLLKVIDEVQAVGGSTRVGGAATEALTSGNEPADTERQPVKTASDRPPKVAFRDPAVEPDPVKRAEMLGLQLKGPLATNERVDSLVSFAGNEVSWPWRLTPAAIRAAKLPHGNRDELVAFDKMTLAVLYEVREVNVPEPGTLAWALKTETFEVTVASDYLRELGLAQRYGDGFAITSNGRLFLAWLLRIGFEFQSASSSAVPTR